MKIRVGLRQALLQAERENSALKVGCLCFEDGFDS
eukprot:COSAG01_NODE_30795_length_609_cov_1.307843_1_plen_34_part_01